MMMMHNIIEQTHWISWNTSIVETSIIIIKSWKASQMSKFMSGVFHVYVYTYLKILRISKSKVNTLERPSQTFNICIKLDR